MVFKNIEAERVRKELTKEEMASQVGVSLKTYYNWLNGVNPIPSTALIKMAEILGKDIDYLLANEKYKPEMTL